MEPEVVETYAELNLALNLLSSYLTKDFAKMWTLNITQGWIPFMLQRQKKNLACLRGFVTISYNTRF